MTAENEATNDKIKIEKPEPSGIKITPTKGEIPPPIGEEEEFPPEEIPIKKITGKIPLSPAVIKPPLRLEGLVLAETTGWEGWIYQESDLDDLCALIEQCGIEADPKIQVLLALGTLHGAKFTAYLAWKRGGRRGDLRKKRETGEVEKKPVPPEEKVIP